LNSTQNNYHQNEKDNLIKRKYKLEDTDNDDDSFFSTIEPNTKENNEHNNFDIISNNDYNDDFHSAVTSLTDNLPNQHQHQRQHQKQQHPLANSINNNDFNDNNKKNDQSSIHSKSTIKSIIKPPCSNFDDRIVHDIDGESSHPDDSAVPEKKKKIIRGLSHACQVIKFTGK